MPILSSSDVAELRAIDESAMTDTCVIQRADMTNDGIGGFNEAWSAIGTVCCRLRFPSMRINQEAVTGGQLTSMSDGRLAVPFGTDLKATDRVLIKNRTYEVSFVPNGATWQTALYASVTSFNEEQRV